VKPGQTNRILNFRSSHPQATKANIIANELKRIAERTQSIPQAKIFQANFQSNLLVNEYPLDFITKNQKTQKEKPPNQFESKIAIPFLGSTSHEIKRILQSSGIQTFFSNTQNCRHLCKNHPQTEIAKQSDIVYKVPCANCNKFYIGQTKQFFQAREKQHEAAIKGKNPENAFASHHAATKHLPNWKEATSVFHEQNLVKRLILETATIAAHKIHTTNLTTGPYKEVLQMVPQNYNWPGGATIATIAPQPSEEKEAEGKLPVTNRRSLRNKPQKKPR
jgi:hypothetical protein